MHCFYVAAFKAFCETSVAGPGCNGENRAVSDLLEYKGIAAEAQRGVTSTRTRCSAAREVPSHQGNPSPYLRVAPEYQGCLTSEDIRSEVQGILADP